jgi:hypothetical protein
MDPWKELGTRNGVLGRRSAPVPPKSGEPAAVSGQARAGDGLRVLGRSVTALVGAGEPPEGAAGEAGRWSSRELVLRRSCVSGGATDGSGGRGGAPRWW